MSNSIPYLYVNFRKGANTGIVYALLNSFSDTHEAQLYSLEHGHEYTGRQAFIDTSLPIHNRQEYMPLLTKLREVYENVIENESAVIKPVARLPERIALVNFLNMLRY